MREAPVVVRQVFLLQILVGGLMVSDFLAPQFLYQTVLVRAVVAFHPAFRLGGIGRDNANPQPLAHAPKLRPWPPRRAEAAARSPLSHRLFSSPCTRPRALRIARSNSAVPPPP